MYNHVEISTAMSQRSRIAARARKLRDIFAVAADEPWAADAVFSAVPDTEDFEISGFFGVVRAEFGFGQANIDGAVRFVGRYDFRLLGRRDTSESLWSLIFTATGDLVDVDRMSHLDGIEEERYSAAKRLLVGEVLQKWLDGLPTFD